MLPIPTRRFCSVRRCGLPDHQTSARLPRPGLEGECYGSTDAQCDQGRDRDRDHPQRALLPGSVPVRALPSLAAIIFTPLRSSNFCAVLPGPILNRAALFAHRLLRDVHFAAAGSPTEDRAFTKLILAYQLVFRKALRGEVGCKMSARRLALMTARLI